VKQEEETVEHSRVGITGKLMRALVAAVVLTGAACSGDTDSEKPDPATFYKNNILHIIVGFNPGGGFDEYARMIGTEISTRTGGTVVVENQPGGGGLLALNRLVQGRPNGQTIMLLGGESAVLAQLTGRPGTRFDINKLNWLGRAQIDTPTMLWSKTNPERTFEEVLNRIQEKGSTWGAIGLTDNISDAASAIAHALDIEPEKFKIVTGYSGSSEVALAVVRGEVDGMVVSNSSAINYVGTDTGEAVGGVSAVTVLSREREMDFFPDVPTVFEVADVSDEGAWWLDFRSMVTEVGRTFVMHGDVDEDKVAYLRKILADILTDEKFTAMAAERQRPMNYMSAEQQETLVQRIFSDLTPARIEEVKFVLTQKYIR